MRKRNGESGKVQKVQSLYARAREEGGLQMGKRRGRYSLTYGRNRQTATAEAGKRRMNGQAPFWAKAEDGNWQKRQRPYACEVSEAGEGSEGR